MTAATLRPLDGIRGLTCVGVMIYHIPNVGSFFHLLHAMQLVMAFFCLSGFLMSYHNYGAALVSWRYWLAYFIRRTFRIYPAYALTVVLIWVSWKHGWIKPFLWYRTFGDAEFYAHLQMKMGLGVLWTILIEVQYYLLLPVLVIPLSFMHKRILRFGVLLAIWGGLLYYSCFFADYGLYKHRVMSLLPYLVYFIGGMLACEIYKFCCAIKFPRLTWDMLAFLCITTLIATLKDKTGLMNSSDIMAAWHHPLLFSPLLILLIVSSALSVSVVGVFLSMKPLRFLGKISYSLYLLHTPIILAVFPHTQNLGFASVIIIVGLSILAACTCYSLVEKPSIRVGRLLAEKLA